MNKRTLITIAAIVPAAGLVLAGVFFLAASFMPQLSSYEAAKALADSFVPDGDASQFTQAVYQGMTARMRIAGAVFLLAGGLSIAFRRYAHVLTDSIGEFTRDMLHTLRAWYREQSAVHLIAFGLVFVAGIAVRVYYLFEQSVRNDEAITAVDHTTRSFLVIAAGYFNPNNQILHTFLTRIAYLVLGFEPWVLRLPAFAAGVLMLPVVYFTFRRLYTAGAGLIATALAASSSLLIFYSTSARGYSMMIVAFLLAIIFVAKLKETDTPGGWFFLVVSSVIGLWTVPLMLYPLGMVFIWYGAAALVKDTVEQPKTALRNAVLAGIAIGIVSFVLYSPSFVATDILGAVQSNTAYKAGQLREPDRLGAVLWLWDRWNDGVLTPFVLLIAAGAVLSLGVHWVMSRDRIPFVLTFFVWILPLFLMQPFAPPHRFYLFLLPIYLGLSAVGLAWPLRLLEKALPRLRTWLTPVVAVLLSGIITTSVVRSDRVFTTPDGWRMHYVEEITLFLKDHLQPGDRIFTSFFFGGSPHFDYFFQLYDVPVEFSTETWNRNDLITDRTEHLYVIEHRRTRRLSQILREGAVPPRHPLVDSVGIVRSRVPTEEFSGPTCIASFRDPYNTRYANESRRDDFRIYVMERRSAQSEQRSTDAD